jgi:tetratricopeptide (TPR) repeat protein
MRREIADVLETVKRAKDRNRGCTLLIGAGCSVKAGIPMASEFVEIIRKEYPRAYDRAPEKTYPHVMAELLMSERRDLITHYINNAKINWAHLAIAQLLKYGFVDRVLTVNFDPLVMRACALVGVFPAVYDFAASQIFKPDFIAQQSIFHLHGQHTGLVVLNTESEVDRLSQHLGPLFTDSVRRRVWIVAGYSGENDPVFEHLAKTERYDNGLYWICYKDNPPKKHVQERLLVGGKDCFCIQGFDADDFFVKLAQGLGCFPPTFVQTPFTHLENILQPVLPYSLPGNDSSLEAIPKKLLQDAIEKIEKPGSVALKARELLLMGNYNAVIEMETELANTRTDELVELVAWGYLYAGNEFGLEADGKTGEEADRLWSQAYKKYAAALKIDPNCSEALNNWAVALDSQARTKNGQEAEQLWALAVEKYGAALKINPEFADPLYNWGRVLVAQAERKKGKAVQQLLMRAAQKYEEALKIEPDKIAALDNWGHVLFYLAQATSGKQADQLWTQAAEKFEAIVRLDPKDCDALTNGAMVLLKHSLIKTVEEADRMWTLAAEKCKAALKLKPDDHTAFYNWSLALQLRADNSIPKEAKRLHELASEKLAAARAIAPELYPVEEDEEPKVQPKKRSTARRRKRKKS